MTLFKLVRGCGISLAMAVAVFPQLLIAQTNTFIPTSGTVSWGLASNWDTNIVPSGPDVSVAFQSPTATEVVNLDGARTVGSMSITNNSNPAVAFTLQNGTSGSLTFDTSGANASLTVGGTGLGVSTISASTTLNRTLDVSVNNTAPTSASGALTMTGSVSGAGGVTKNGAGIMSFTSAAKTYTGATVVNAGVLRYTAAGASTGTSSITVNSGGQMRLDSSAGTFTFGSAVITLNGAGTGSSVGALLNANSGAVTLANNISLASAATISTTSTTTGASFQLNGVVSGPGQLTKAGAGNLILNATNSYSGGTVITAGTLTVLRDGGLGSGDVSLTASGVTLTLQNGAVNNYIADTANLSIVSGVTVNLNFTGTDTIFGLNFNGNALAPGIYGSSASGAPNQLAELAGMGTLTVVPEPATYVLLGIGLLACAQRFRRAKKQ